MHQVLKVEFFNSLLAFRWDSGRKSKLDFLKCGMVCTVSFLAPLIIAALWLAANSALGPFADIFFNYLPLHSAMTGLHEILSRHDRASYLVSFTLKVGGYRVMVLCAIFAYYRVLAKSKKTRQPKGHCCACLSLLFFFPFTPPWRASSGITTTCHLPIFPQYQQGSVFSIGPNFQKKDLTTRSRKLFRYWSFSLR